MATEKVGIEIELIGGEEAHRLLQNLDKDIDRLNKRKSFRSLSGLNKSKAELESYIKELERLQQAQKRMQARGISTKNTDAKIASTTAKIREMSKAYQEATVKTRTFKQEFNAMSSKVAHAGSALQSFGNALTRFSTPFRMITNGFLMGTGYKLLNMFTEGFGGAFERYDIMQTYSKTLKAFGFEAEESQIAIDKLNEAVLGLPTGLDEIVAVQKRFVASSQDLDKSTDLAIAYNNAILASASDARQQKVAQRILSQLIGGAEIASTSWDALQRAIPLVFTELAKDSKMGVADYVSALKTGKISTDEFIKSFSKIGTEGSIQAAANVMKTTWGGLAANLTNATKRMGENILKALDDVFISYNGRNLVQNLLGFDAEGNEVGGGIKHWINDLSESVQNWIKSHPEEIKEFFDTLKSIDWKGLARGFAQGIGDILKWLEKLAKFAEGKDLSKLGRFLAKAGLWGQGFTILGGLIKGLRHPIGLLGTLGKMVGKGGIAGKLGEIVVGSGGGIGNAINGATFKGVGKAGLLGAEVVGIIGGLSAMITGFAALDMKFLSSAVKSFNKITEDLLTAQTNLAKVKAVEIDKEAIGNLVKDIGSVWLKLEGLDISSIDSRQLSTAINAVWNIIHDLRRIAYQVNHAASTAVDVGGLAVFVEQINAAMEELKNLNGEIELDVQVKLNPSFETSVKKVCDRIKKGREKITALKSGINISIPVRVTFSVSTNLGGALGAIKSARDTIKSYTSGVASNFTFSGGGGKRYRFEANGGAVYRSRGGGIGFPGRPRGTDTIPAWLTKGEFVHNRKAVDTFGIDFMRKVNNLDVKGAMNELMHKAGHVANINRGTSITNNNYNNQRVTINNNGGSGAGYTFKSASRFVGAF